MKRKFYLFLKENGAWDEYKRYAKIEGNPLLWDETDWVLCAFNWETSDSGWEYWSDINNKWFDLI
jgi:hypothetical protein